MPRTYETAIHHTEFSVRRFRATEIEEAVRERVLVPQVLPVHQRLALAHLKLTDARVQKAVDAAQCNELLAVGMSPYSITEGEGNQEVNGGINNMLRLLIGSTTSSGGTNYANGIARLGVGTSTTAVDPTQTDLQAATGGSTRQWVPCDSTFPSVAGQILTAQATFGTSLANFHWQEWGMDSGTSAGTSTASGLFNRRVVDLSTKGSSATWVLSITITQF